ncbi:MAG: phenylalanine--tRNA ligase subunit beta [Acidimicrobiia bacterium]
MKVSLNWLSEYIDLPTRDPVELRRVLETVGHEVEDVERLSIDWTGVVIARVETVSPHPDADKVRVCTVTAGGDPITVVCGAWNFEEGAIVAFARPGAVLPGDFHIGVRTIRGVESHGMICSERELDLGDDAAGILVLDPDAPVGKALESILALPDVVFDLDITPNRPDAMSMVGIARDLAAWFRSAPTVPSPMVPTVAGGTEIAVKIEDPAGNPRFVARRVDGVSVSDSPLWMRLRLRAAGIRPVSNLVDVTNYVMLELGQPLHVFDADRVVGDELVVRRAVEGEELVTLDGVSRTLGSDDLVICDADGPTSLAGTMGGLRSEVSAATTSTLIEAASWDPPTIMRMSKRHGLRSEASARFERGVDPNLPPPASLRAAELIVASAGGALREEFVDEVALPHEPVSIVLSNRDVTRLLGNDFDTGQISDALGRLGFQVAEGDPRQVSVPSYRPDVTRPADLVEEVARLAGYETFDERLRLGTGGGLTADQRRARRIREVLVSLGCSQAVALSFVMPAEVAAFDPPPDHELTRTVLVKNPLSDEEAVLRPTLLPGLLRSLRHNRNRGQANVALFEEGRVFHNVPWASDRRVPDQPIRLAVAAVGVVGPADLAGKGQDADVEWITAVIRHLARTLGVGLTLEQGNHPGYHPTRTAQVVGNGQVIGYAGELHPLTAERFELDGRVAVAEIDFQRLLDARTEPIYQPVSPYPPADFDLSFDVDADLPAAALVSAVGAGDEGLVETIDVFDEFRGPGVAPGRKAVAVRVRLRAPDRTLDTDEIGAVRRAMVDSAATVGARLRGSE